MKIIAQTPRLIIREFAPQEESLLVELLTDERITPFIPQRNEEQIIQLFRDALEDYAAGSKLTRWGVFSSDTGEFIGLGMLKYYPDRPLEPEVGFAIHDYFKGMGIATELTKALLNYGFTEANVSVISAITVPENIASKKALKKAGLKQIEDQCLNDRIVSCFRITAEEFLGEGL